MNVDEMRGIPVGFYRLGWKDRMKSWSKEKKKKVLMEISKISLERPITAIAPQTRLKLKSVPSETFSGLQLYAGMLELYDALGYPSVGGDSSDAIVKAFGVQSKKKLKDVV